MPVSSCTLRIALLAVGGFAVVTASLPVSGDEASYTRPPQPWTARDALRVLSDSPWAHTITTSLQDAPCTHRNAAFPGLFSEDEALRKDALDGDFLASAPPAKPDGAEYLVRLLSVKPIQAAAARLASVDQNPYHLHKIDLTKDDHGEMISVAII